MSGCIKVLGVGSPTCADSIGWGACDWLESIGVGDLIPTVGFTFETLDRPGPSLIEAFKGSLGVVIIDAMRSSAQPGSVKRIDIDELLQQPNALSSHKLGVAESLALADSLGSLPKYCVVLGIESEGLENEAVEQLPENIRTSLLRELGTVVQRWVEEGG